MIHEYSDYPLLKYNTFGMNVYAKKFIEYSSVNALKKVLQQLYIAGDLPYILCIGRGSNLLFMKDYEGVVLHSCINGITVVKETEQTVQVRVGAGVIWDDFVAWCVEHEWYGAENLSGIPGEVGASAIQNIGAYGVEVKDLICRVEALEIATSKEIIFTNEDCAYNYRQSRFKNDWKGKYVITYVTYELSKLPVYHLDYGNLQSMLAHQELTLQTVCRAIREIRDSKLPDPNIQGNAGSFFMNPMVTRSKLKEMQTHYPDIPYYEVNDDTVKIPAGWLIERCGWKGRSLGRAGVHDKQALVLVNLGGATGTEIMKLAEAICKDITEKFDIELHPEVNCIH